MPFLSDGPESVASSPNHPPDVMISSGEIMRRNVAHVGSGVQTQLQRIPVSRQVDVPRLTQYHPGSRMHINLSTGIPRSIDQRVRIAVNHTCNSIVLEYVREVVI